MDTHVKRGNRGHGPTAFISVGLRVTPTEHAALRRLADADRRSLNQQVRHLIERAADEHDKAAA